MRFVIVTGMSGAGKSTTMKILEDLGYFCVDNLPIMLINKFVDLAFGSESNEISQIAIGVDARSGHSLMELDNIIEGLKASGKKCEILFLEASDETLIKRFKETRRSHPLISMGRVDEGIAKEREMLAFLKVKADYIIDTDSLLVRELRGELEKIFIENKEYKNIIINVLSFGFKYGIPTDADLVFDVRFLPNPYYVEELRPKTGNDTSVNSYVMNSEISVEFVNKLFDMIKFLIPNYIAEGKNQLVIAIGCTGGKHRSVTVANLLYKELSISDEYGIKLTHRDIERR
ncbi:MAG: RNase adapter RapZ [Lachnospiraceae bacterium]|nr:RNase adapter RapZ [Lachnospiraceae bacterium]